MRSHLRVSTQTCKIPNTSEKSPVPTSLSTVQSQMPNRNFVVAAATLVTVTLCFHNFALSCFTLNEAFDKLQQQETLYCGYTNPGSVRTIARANEATRAIDTRTPISSGHELQGVLVRTLRIKERLRDLRDKSSPRSIIRPSSLENAQHFKDSPSLIMSSLASLLCSS